MDIIGIICEYNPFHNGHIYHIDKIKKMYPNSLIILVMSGNYTERGEISILNKWDKTRIALNHNIDLVVELPFCFAGSSADRFSHAAIQILNALHVQKLVFGSECNNVEKLKQLAITQLYNKEYDPLIKKYLDKGINYPTALANALAKLNGYNINTPNDLLGLCYIKEIIKNNYDIEPISIQRTNNYHDKNINNNITSASSIREALKNNIDIKKYVPEDTYKYITNIDYNNYYKLLKYKILSNIDNLNIYQTVDEGIENRIKKYIIHSKSIDELIKNIKTKRYTYNKINRMFNHILCNYTKEENNVFKDIEYIRILGFNKQGRNYLNKIKKTIEYPIITKYSDIDNKMLKLEFRVTSIYSSIINENLKIIEEYKSSPIIM